MSPAVRTRRTPTGLRQHAIRLQNSLGVISDGDGAYSQVWADLPPAFAAITPATGRDLERVAGTVAAIPTHVLNLPYQENISTRSRVVFGSRVFNILGVQNVDERNIELVLLCAEVEGSVDVPAVEMLIAELGGDSFAFQQPAVADAYLSGATFDKLVPGSWPVTLNASRLLAGTYLLEASARVSDVGARAKVALVDLDDPDDPIVEIAFSTSELVGETKRSAAFTIPTSDTRYAVKVTTDDVAIGAAVWGAHILKTS